MLFEQRVEGLKPFQSINQDFIEKLLKALGSQAHKIVPVDFLGGFLFHYQSWT